MPRKKTIEIMELVTQVAGFFFVCLAFADINKTLFALRTSIFFMTVTYTSFSWCPSHISIRYKFMKIIAALMFASATYCFVKTAAGYGYIYTVTDYIASCIIFGILFTYITIFVVRNTKRYG